MWLKIRMFLSSFTPYLTTILDIYLISGIEQSKIIITAYFYQLKPYLSSEPFLVAFTDLVTEKSKLHPHEPKESRSNPIIFEVELSGCGGFKFVEAKFVPLATPETSASRFFSFSRSNV